MRRTSRKNENTAAAEFRQRAREHGEDALKTLVGIMNGTGNETARITAAREVLDRAYGKTSVPPPEAQESDRITTIRYVNDWRHEGEEDL